MSDKSGDPVTAVADEATERDHPVAFREILALREYRAVYFSLLVNLLGDYLSKAAITVLVYQQSQSVVLSAAAFAVTYLPWVLGGTLLATLADRYPYRNVMILVDLARMVLVVLLLIPGLPVTAMLALLFLSCLGAPAAQASRSAMMPQLVDRRMLPTALALNGTTGQAAQMIGYLTGAALATGISPQVALLADAASFGISAFLVAAGVRHRPAALAAHQRHHLLADAADGIRIVFARQTLRSIALMVFVLVTVAIVPEGLAAAWAAEGADPADRGLYQGVLMAAGPVGFVLGGIVINRLVAPSRRDRMIRPLAILSTSALVPVVTAPPLTVIVLLVLLSGVAIGGLMPMLTGKFALILPHGYRARAFGVMQGSMQICQFAGVVVTGMLAEHFSLPLVVGLWSLGGTALMATFALNWPSEDTFEAAMREVDEPAQAEPRVPAAVPEHP